MAGGFARPSPRRPDAADAICRERGHESCPANRAFARKAGKLGGHVDVLPMALTHGEINRQLGLSGAYTDRVEDFMRELGWML
jgi:arylformamidase